MSNDNENDIEDEPSPFIDHKNNSNKQVEITEFSTWYSKIFLTKLQTFPEHPITNAENDNTSTIRYFVVYTKPKQDYIDFIEGTQEHVCFWIKNFFILKEGFDELEKYIKSLFTSIISEKLVFPLLKGDVNDLQMFRQAKLRKDQLETKEKKRFVFHYIAHQTENTPLNGIEFLNCSCLPLRDLLDISGESSLFIFDRDKAGSLFPIFSEYAQSKDLENYLVAFFACGANESLPRSSDYPIDLFTSCLNSPARIALVWHSRQYFCFQSGSLQPLSLMFVEEMETFDRPNINSNQKQRIKSILDDITSLLRSIVESIALHSMDPVLFVKMFRTDKVLSKLTVNFIFACHILSIFNIHPVSYPRMPDMSNCSEWHTFALRLDASLYALNHPDEDGSIAILSHHHFLSQVLVTFQSKIDAKSSNLSTNSNLNKRIELPFELSFFRSIIKDKQLCEPALKTLAKYLDSSPLSIMKTLFFPIPGALFKLLIKNAGRMPSKYLVFCLVKILVYYKPSRSLLLKMNTSYQNMIKKVLIDAFKSCLLGGSFQSFSSLSSSEFLPKSTSMSASRPSSFAQCSLLTGLVTKNVVSQNIEVNPRDETGSLVSSTSSNCSSKKTVSSNSSIDRIPAMSSGLAPNDSGSIDTSEDLTDYPVISHLLMILFALLMKDSFKLFKEIIIPQNLFSQSSSDQNIFSQQIVDQLDIDSKIWLLLMVTRAAEATKDYQIIKKLLSLILKVYNSKQKKQQIQSQIVQIQKNSKPQPPPELHAAIVCALSSLIKEERAFYRTSANALQIRENIEHNAAQAAFNFSDSSLVNVRLELFVMAQKFVKANPTVMPNGSNDFLDVKSFNISQNDALESAQEDDNEVLYKKVRRCIETSRSDPNEGVRNAEESTLFNFFNSALMSPIRKMLFGPFSLDEISKDPYQFDSQFTLSSAASETSLNVEIEQASVDPSAAVTANSSDVAESISRSNSSSLNPPKHAQNQRQARMNRKANLNQNQLMKELVVNSSFHHSSPITSRLVFLNENKIAFGDITGTLNVKDWCSGPKFQILPQKKKELREELKMKAKISPKPLTCVEYDENGMTNPLFFTVDSGVNGVQKHHDCRVSSLKLPDYSVATTAVFPLFENDRIYLDKKRGHLYSYCFNEGQVFHVRDLRTDQLLSPITPKYGSTKDIKSFGNFDDVVAICGEAFEIFDLRISTCEPVKSIMREFSAPPITMRVIDESIPTFAIALEGHIAVYLDSRHEKWARSIVVECLCKEEEMVTCGFDFSKKSKITAIGTEHGVTCIQMQNNYQNEVLNIKNGTSLAYSEGLLFHPDKYELAFVSNKEYIITAI